MFQTNGGQLRAETEDIRTHFFDRIREVDRSEFATTTERIGTNTLGIDRDAFQVGTLIERILADGIAIEVQRGNSGTVPVL